MDRKMTLQWFILGLGSQLQVLFSLSVSEMIVLVMAPFLFISELPYMRKDGVITFLYVSILLFFGCVASLIANHAQFYQVIRGLSITSIIVCMVVVGHYMIRRDPNGLKWYFIGVTLSTFLCIYVFQRSVEVYLAGGDTDAAAISTGKLFWVDRLNALLTVPMLAYYLKTPLFYSVGVLLFLALFSILTTTSGRSASLVFFGMAAMVLVGRKKRTSMMALGKHFMLFFCFAVLGLFLAKVAYQWAALNNVLGEEALEKYERQTVGGRGVVSLLMSGRTDAFAGLLAVADAPFLGKGYWARDTEGYRERFLARYGTPDDYEHYKNYTAYCMKMGFLPDKGIPCHSHIVSFWVWYGLPGLIFWLYVIYVMFRYLKNDVQFVPQWFFWLAGSVPVMLWHIFFSPFNARIGLPLYVIGMLMTRAVRLGKYQLPWKMILEIEKTERA